MQTLNYWKQFEHTGRVEDYLSYVSSGTGVPSETNMNVGGTASVQVPAANKETEGNEKDKAGANPYAGIHMGNRNDIKADACRGI